MRWTPGGQNPDVEDRRGSSGGGGFGGFSPRIGIGGFVVLLLLSLIFHRNFFAMLGGGAPADAPAGQAVPANQTPEEKNLADFVGFVLGDVQDTWTKVFAQSNAQYRHAKLVLFREGINSGCGFAQTAMGPFYCPADEKVYVDLGFYDELRQRFGASGDFAQAYVIAHEVGHHVQNLLGISEKVQRAQQANPDQANALSVRLELQADCLAGVWAHSTQQRNILDPGDVDEALNAAASVGDDRIQKQATGRVSPESWTHGSAQQRSQWFHTGFESGSVDRCDTFASR